MIPMHIQSLVVFMTLADWLTLQLVLLVLENRVPVDRKGFLFWLNGATTPRFLHKRIFYKIVTNYFDTKASVLLDNLPSLDKNITFLEGLDVDCLPSVWGQ